VGFFVVIILVSFLCVLGGLDVVLRGSEPRDTGGFFVSFSLFSIGDPGGIFPSL
jgi:hypothetical protein